MNAQLAPDTTYTRDLVLHDLELCAPFRLEAFDEADPVYRQQVISLLDEDPFAAKRMVEKIAAKYAEARFDRLTDGDWEDSKGQKQRKVSVYAAAELMREWWGL